MSKLESALESKKREFVEAYSSPLSALGLPRMTGRVLGWLLVCNPPEQSAGQLSEALEASKGSISTTMRFLHQADMVERLHKRGSRETFYRLKQGVWANVLRRRFAMFTWAREMAEEGLRIVGESRQGRDRLQEMLEFYTFAENEIGPVFDKWERERGGK